jgi:alpha-mannosidase
VDCAQIFESIEKLRRLTHLNVQTGWQYCETDLPISEVAASAENWPIAPLNAKGHIAWKGGRQVVWLFQRLRVPVDLHGYPLEGLTLRLSLSWWAEDAQIFVNGKLAQQGDLFDCAVRVLLSPAVIAGEEFTVLLRVVSPNHDNGALVRSQCVWEMIDEDCIDPGFVADELAVLQHYLETFEPAQLDTLSAAIAEINWAALPNRQKFERTLFSLRQTLQSQLQPIKSKIYLLGHAHLDLAWLWPVSETWVAAQRTFESVLALQLDFPDLIFCHSSPALYAWIEEHRPDLFAAIQQQVAAGKWEIVGGMWVEPDVNLIAGESIVRQILYGQRYIQEKFGQLMPVAWLPDSFGFCWQLPQLLKQGGVEYFVTQKLRWNDTTKFPHGSFWWQSPDGTQICSYMSALIGESLEPVKMTKYVCEWETQTTLKDSLWLPGVGDHGGGPTRDMLEIAQRWQQSPFFPRMEFTSAVDYLSLINSLPGQKTLPVWKDELYLEFHRGCYTTHADQKRWNRQCEGLLYQAELFASLATLTAGDIYPKIELEDAWKKVLFNQFHDILPGSSIPEVYVDANEAWIEVEQVCQSILNKAISSLSLQMSLPKPPQPNAQAIIVLNPLNWLRSEVVAVSLPAASNQEWQIYDLAGKLVTCQLSEASTLLFLATDIPSVGYRVYWLSPMSAEKLNLDVFLEDNPKKDTEISQETNSLSADSNPLSGKETEDWVLKNDLLRVNIDASSGDLSQVLDKINKREIINQVGNQLQIFQDSGQYWDAWNIDPNYEQHPLPAPKLKEIYWVEKGKVRQRLRVVKELGDSQFQQDYVLDANSPVVKIENEVNWQERHVLVKAAFPLNVEADFATYEIACGAIQRTTKPQTPAEKAKWEVPALRWADLSTDNYGVSLLNDCKYGYDAQSNQLRLTLLRGSTWPNPEADQGIHQFTYAIYPHAGSWQNAQTVRRGYELNIPLQVKVIVPVGENQNASLPASGSFLELSAENFILMAFKPAEDHPNAWILRGYECHGEEADLNLKSDIGLAISHCVDLLERTVDTVNGQSFKIEPWKVVGFQCTSKF